MEQKENTEKASFERLAALVDHTDLEPVSYKSLISEPRAHVLELDMTTVLDPDLGPGSSPITCRPTPSLDVAGAASTGENGRRRLRLSEFLCEARSTLRPVSFVATPLSLKPVLLTTRIVLVGNDLVIDVFSWDTSGNPAAKVAFSWRCWAQVPVVIL